MWLRFGLADANEIPAIWPADYLSITDETQHMSGIVMRQQLDPWRIDVLCVPTTTHVAATFLALPVSSLLTITKMTWIAPEKIEPTLLLTDDRNGLAMVSLSYAWQALNISSLVLWQTQGNLPFSLAPSHMYTPALPANVIATMLDIEAMGVVLRVISHEEKPGCFCGDPQDLLALCPALQSWQQFTDWHACYLK